MLTEENPAFHVHVRFIYIARPDSHIYGRPLHLTRRRMGQELAREYPVEADIVIAVPDSGTPAAIGYAEASKIPYGEGLIKNRYIHRTFIQPDQRLRELGVRMKLNPLREALMAGAWWWWRTLIVRGTSTRNIVKVLREAGAKEIHLRITSPPYRYPCFFGVDTFERKQLLASRIPKVEEICGISAPIPSATSPSKAWCAPCPAEKHLLPGLPERRISRSISR